MSETRKYPKDWTPVEGCNFTDILYEKKYKRSGAIARISNNRPHRRNRISPAMMSELIAALRLANVDRHVAAIVWTGVGDEAFCLGPPDIKGADPRKLELGTREAWWSGNQLQLFMRRCRKPIVAVVKGDAIAGGNHFAYFADFTIAAENAVFGQIGPHFGIPVDGFIPAYLARVIGAKKAREVWMLCRKYTAQEALQMGLVNVIVPLDKIEEETEKWCDEILAKNQYCLEMLKASFDADINDLIYSANYLSWQMYPEYIGSDAALEGQHAFLEGRQPDWSVLRGGPFPVT